MATIQGWDGGSSSDFDFFSLHIAGAYIILSKGEMNFSPTFNQRPSPHTHIHMSAQQDSLLLSACGGRIG